MTTPLEHALGGQDATRDYWRAVTPATRAAIVRIAEIHGDEEPAPAVCARVALDHGASVEAILAITHGLDLADATDAELIAVHRICTALDDVDDALEGAQ